MAKLGKEQFVRSLAEAKGLTIKEAKEATNNVFDHIVDVVSEMEDGDKLEFQGVVQFITTKAEATTGRNPQTGEAIDIPEKMRVRAKTLSRIKNAVN
jgi:DNA-binding protein HU-beta